MLTCNSVVTRKCRLEKATIKARTEAIPKKTPEFNGALFFGKHNKTWRCVWLSWCLGFFRGFVVRSLCLLPFLAIFAVSLVISGPIRCLAHLCAIQQCCRTLKQFMTTLTADCGIVNTLTTAGSGRRAKKMVSKYGTYRLSRHTRNLWIIYTTTKIVCFVFYLLPCELNEICLFSIFHCVRQWLCRLSVLSHL